MEDVFDMKALTERIKQIELDRNFTGVVSFSKIADLLLEVVEGLAVMDVTDGVDFVYLNLIKVKQVKKGTGTSVMNCFCAFLDFYKVDCRLTVDPFYGTDYDVLQKFYRSFGFENYDTTGTELIREPQANVSL